MTTYLMVLTGLAIVVVALWGLLTRRHLIKLVIAFSLLDTGVHVLLVAIGYRSGGTAPIVDAALPAAEAVARAVDPIPSALVLTAIVIGLAVTALMLTYVVGVYQRRGSLLAEEHKELKC